MRGLDDFARISWSLCRSVFGWAVFGGVRVRGQAEMERSPTMTTIGQEVAGTRRVGK